METLGYYPPWVLSGTILTTIAYRLLSLLGPTTSVHQWIGYQVLFGVGCGSAATGVSSSLVPLKIPNHQFHRSNASSISYGAYQLTVLSFQAYSTSVDRVMYLGIGISAAAFAFAWRLGWKDIRAEKWKVNE